MSTNQPLSDSQFVPVIESVLGAAPPVAIGSTTSHAQVQADGWRAIEERIAGWVPGRADPSPLIDADGYLLPSSETVALALQIAARLREAGVSVPSWLVQDGNGGIDFEWRSNGRAETLTVNSRSEIELMRFENSKLVGRKLIAFPPAHR